MIISNIIGGLGNQMFQYACARALSLRQEAPLRVATDQFPLFHSHNGFEIASTFRCRPQFATRADMVGMLGWQSPPGIRRLLARPAITPLQKRAWVQEPSLRYWSGIEQVRAPAYLSGYWQSELYFSSHIQDIRSDFQFDLEWDAPDLAVREQLQAGTSVSVHVRRGDYTTAKNKGIYAGCTLDYYRAALRHVRQKAPGARIFLFSDDPHWAQTNLQPEFGEMVIVSHNRGARSSRDMRLMSLASHHVIANSSFSWWGAWLNDSPDKIVVAPRQWFVDESRRDSSDLVPAKWIRL